VKIAEVPVGDDLAGVTFGDIGAAGVGTGGAATKVSAARLAAASGTAVLVTSTALVADALSGRGVGTFFEPSEVMREPFASGSVPLVAE
jgi:glutamate 5-kinase